MRITESRLRRIIRNVILEQYNQQSMTIQEFALAVLKELESRGFYNDYTEGDRMLEEPIYIGTDNILRDRFDIKRAIKIYFGDGSIDEGSIERCVDACEDSYKEEQYYKVLRRSP